MPGEFWGHKHYKSSLHRHSPNFQSSFVFVYSIIASTVLFQGSFLKRQLGWTQKDSTRGPNIKHNHPLNLHAVHTKWPAKYDKTASSSAIKFVQSCGKLKTWTVFKNMFVCCIRIRSVSKKTKAPGAGFVVNSAGDSIFLVTRVSCRRDSRCSRHWDMMQWKCSLTECHEIVQRYL